MPRLAVVGQPVAHSRSPVMQTAALAELGLAGEWSYEAIEVSPEEFASLVSSLPGEGFAGVNVTVPHKLAALDVADRASDAAREIGAANMLSFADRAIEADNTDAVGVLEALPEPVGDRRALVMGAGGSARAVVWALRRSGAQVLVWNRTWDRAEELAVGLGAAVVPRAARGGSPPERFDLIVNATTVGLEQASSRAPAPGDLDPLPIEAASIGPGQVVVDLVYGPYPTALVAAARERGAEVVDGLEILVRQGAASLRKWTGLEPPLEAMRRAARDG